MRRYAPIKRCDQCDFYNRMSDRYGSTLFVCTHKNGLRAMYVMDHLSIVSDENDPFPEWCPLDKEEKDSCSMKK